MSSPARRKSNAPIAPRKKRVRHALTLAQPFLQFFALMAVLFALGRCSPMASSMDKSVNKASSNAAVTPHDQANNGGVVDADIQKQLRPVSNWKDLAVLKQSEFTSQVAANSLDADFGADLSRVNKLLSLRSPRHNVRLLLVHLDQNQREALFKPSGSVRIDLVERLSAHMDADSRKALFGGVHALLRKPSEGLSGKAYLVLPDDNVDENDPSIPVATQIDLAIADTDDKAWLQITNLNRQVDATQQNQIDTSISTPGSFVALVLE